jgi:hypothetical protein
VLRWVVHEAREAQPAGARAETRRL